jgi:hypothetical protein
MASEPELPRLERRVDRGSHRRFLEVTGRRVALLGNELGVFEGWIWPFKVCRELELSVRTATLRRGRDLARSVAFQPDRTEIELVGPGYRVRQTLLAALDRRALVVRCDVESELDLELELGFLPELVPMWPAGLGGRIALRDEASGAVALSEELGRFAALVGSPEAEPVEVRADHGLPREPVALRVPVSAARAARGPILFFAAGAETEPASLSGAARVGEEDAARGLSRAQRVIALAREEYRWIASHWRDVERELAEHWRDFLARTTHFESDDARHAEAFLWAKIAIEKAWVEVDGLGRGLVAGLAQSGAGERPGFGWFFDGDAIVASRAMTGYGDWKGARRALDFAASHQRADGKMMHELVLSARLCNWFEDYPYAYYKAQLTPGFVSCLSHYFTWSGDREFLQQMWPAAVAAYRCCLAHLEDDGLLSNRKLGIAAVEAGPLVGRIRSDIYLQGIWISALRGIPWLAHVLGNAEIGKQAKEHLERADERFESFWSDHRGRYSFAHLSDGELCHDLTAYQALPLSRGIGDEARARSTAAALNRPSLASDWGVRLFSNDASVYDASNYNTGSVFPYANNFAILAQFRHGLTTSGQQLLASQVALHGFSGLGFVPEHLYGDRCEAPARGVPHQIFSSACIVQATLFGMLGLEVVSAGIDSVILALEIALPPKCDRVRVNRLRARTLTLGFELQRARTDGRTQIEASFECTGELWVDFAPRLPPLSRDADATIRGTRNSKPTKLRRRGAALQPNLDPLRVVRSEGLTISYEAGPELLLDDSPLVEGSTSSRLRVCETTFDERSVSWTVWGLAGRTYRVGVRSDRQVDFDGAREMTDGSLEIDFPAAPVDVLDPSRAFTTTRVRAIARN